jgi:hypothetical protein
MRLPSIPFPNETVQTLPESIQNVITDTFRINIEADSKVEYQDVLSST